MVYHAAMSTRPLLPHRRFSFAAAALSAAALVAGCGGDDPMPPPHSGDGGAGGAGGSGGAGGAGGGAALTWGACPDDYLDECAYVDMPLDWANPEGRTIRVLASRTLAQGGAGRTQLWLLQGGPGGSGNVFKGLVQGFAVIQPDVDFYVLEHRGVGESTRLGCADEEAPGSELGETISAGEWPSCVQDLEATWGEDLAHFTTTGDARDLQRFIELTREPDKSVMIYGVSYGTYRALRFLQVAPEGADGVILDSVVSPGVQFLSHFDEQFDPVGMDIAALCAADATCGQKMGADPWGSLVTLKQQLAAGHCPALGLTAQDVDGMLPVFVMYRTLREHLFPLVYRVQRCADADVQAVTTYFQVLDNLFAGPGGGPLRGSRALQVHVALSELWEAPEPTAAELQARCDGAVICPRLGPSFVPLLDTWPRYPQDMYVNAWPETAVPVLAMNGTLDPQTPIETALAAADHLVAPGQTFVTVPFSPHGVLSESPVLTPGKVPCGLQMIRGFLADPVAPIDTSCLADLAPVSFTISPEDSTMFFGTPDPWENPAPLTAAARGASQAKPDWAGLVERIRRVVPRIARP